MRAVLLLAFAVAATVLLSARPLAAQADTLQRQIRESQLRLEEIRAERARLQREMETVRSQAQDVSRELQNIERQLSASRSVLAEIDFQVEAIASRTNETTSELVQARDRMDDGQEVLNRRLRDVYKLGPLHTVRVLLGADSFTDLLNRYRYIRLMASYDRRLLDQVRSLERELALRNRELQENLSELSRLRQDKVGEVVELRSIESEHQAALRTFRGRERTTATRLDQLEADERRMTGLIDELDRARREAERRRAATGSAPAGPATLGSEDAGRLDWPVEGELVYRFGREQRPNGTVLRWNGIGIAAAPGTPVRAVRPGTVVMAGPFEGYGPTVVLSHGDGFYTLYLYLDEIGVVEGREVAAGQVVGTVGGQNTPEGPRLEFQIRAPVDGGAPQAMDPLRWLRARGGTP